MTINHKKAKIRLKYQIRLKYELYHQAKFINMNILQVKIYYHLINSK